MTAVVLALTLALNPPDLFVLEVTPVVAVAGGPVVLDITVRYTGVKPLDVHPEYAPALAAFDIRYPAGWFVVPVNWRNRLFWGGGMSFPGPRTLKPGDVVTATQVVAPAFLGVGIPPGPASLEVSWHGVRAYEAPETYRAAALVPVTVSPDIVGLIRYLDAAMRRMESEYGNPAGDYVRASRSAVDVLCASARAELIPTARRLLAMPIEPDLRRHLRGFLCQFPEFPAAFDAADVASMVGGRPTDPNLGNVVGDWRSRQWDETPTRYALRQLEAAALATRLHPTGRPLLPPPPPSDACVRQLLTGRSVWLRSLTLAVFRHRVPPRVAADTLRDLADEVAGIPLATLRRWLRELDAPEFRVRESATKNFVANYRHAHRYIEAVRRRPHSVEVTMRLDKIAATKLTPDPFEGELLNALLNTTDIGRDRPLLDVLAAGSPHCDATRTVIKKLAERAAWDAQCPPADGRRKP